MVEVMTNERSETVEVAAVVASVCDRIPPLWDLPNYVAVNPFLGCTTVPFAETARIIADGLGAQVLPPVSFYRKRWQAGAFERAHVTGAARRLGFNPTQLEAILTGHAIPPRRSAGSVLTFAERHDRCHGSRWHEALVNSTARWCAVYASGGGVTWKLPVASQGLFASWREAAAVDRALEIAGLHGWRRWVRQLPESSGAALELALGRLDMPAAQLEAYLYRLLGGLYGWASFFKRSSWEAGRTEPGTLAELLAVRVCADAAVAALLPRTVAAVPTVPAGEDETVRAALQEALEDGYLAVLLRSLKAPPAELSSPRPDVQAIFCIDVRSEPFRRHLEFQSETIETRGFAGFFGVALEWHTDGTRSARCPVLLKPAVHLCSSEKPASKLGVSSVKYLQSAPAASFSFVETLGLSYGLGLVGDALAVQSTRVPDEHATVFTLDGHDGNLGIALESRLDLARSILTNTGLSTGCARLVVLCGHQGHSTNNPHAAGLDCGACGGHGGALNARVAAAVLNDPAVRAGLPGRGFHLPADTWFIAGVHDTAIDSVTLLDTDRVPASHRDDVAQLQQWLTQTGEQTRAERAVALGVGDVAPGQLEAVLSRRSRDWSEVRPEWGLARNAAFIAARRSRTRGVDLAGRSFLHEYDCAADPDNAVLTLILTAPMVVASWINLQYFASTVDNRVFGAGDKALHNRVGSLGVVLGNGGDLRTGLPLQSVHAPDGEWFHEPLRLQVVVEAPTQTIDQVLARHQGVAVLVDNGWVRLIALDPESTRAARRTPGGGWELVEAVASA